MIKLRHKTLILISGSIWLIVGLVLLPLGLHFLVDKALAGEGATPLLEAVGHWFGGVEQASIALITLGLLVGFFKSRMVLSKSVTRLVSRIRGLPEPASLFQIYTPAYYILLASMIGIGVAIKFFGVTYDIRGFVDVAIGAALINGSTLYFRQAYA